MRHPHHVLCEKISVYHRWHQHPMHPHIHWGFLGSIALGAALVFVGLGWGGFLAEERNIVQAQVVTPTFVDTYDNGKAKAGIQQVGCATGSFSTSPNVYRGTGAFKAEAHDPACNNTNRAYPDYSTSFALPFLVTFWMRVDGASWEAAHGDRFSPLTVKEDPAEGVECKARFFTTQFMGSGARGNAQFKADGRMEELGHSVTTFLSTEVKAPINPPGCTGSPSQCKWFLHSAYVENSGGKTHVTTWINNRVAAEGTTGGVFAGGIVRVLHMGIYGQLNDMTLYNDELKAYAGLSGGVARAAQIIAQELGPGYGSVDTAGQGASSLEGPGQCYDGIDNDGDGYRDYPNDCGCECQLDSREGVEAPHECADRIDNDGDGSTDLNDGGCTGVNDEVEHNSPPSNYPEVGFIANPNNVNSGGSTRVEWTVTCLNDSCTCTKSGAWSGDASFTVPANGTVKGSAGKGPFTSQTDYTLTCTGTGTGGTRARLASVYINPTNSCGQFTQVCTPKQSCTTPQNCPGMCNSGGTLCTDVANDGCPILGKGTGNTPPNKPVVTHILTMPPFF